MGKIYYVDANIDSTGDGSIGTPFKTIQEAAEIAQPGDEVVVKPGTYREHVIPRNKGTEDARIVYRSETPLGAKITGAEIVKDWTQYKDDVWTVKVDNKIFGDFNPYIEKVDGDWYFSPIVRHTGAVFLNDLMMYEVTSIDECVAGEVDIHAWNPEESRYKWYTEKEGDFTVLYANFRGKNPNEENVEISVRRNCFMPVENGIDYITVSGFNITKAATTWAPPAAYQDGMIGPHWSKGWIIEDCEVSNSRCCGISLGKYLDPENDMYFFRKRVKSPTQMERDAVCRGQYHGWLKEKVGSHIVRRCHIHHCGQTGIVGRMGAVFSVIEDCHIHDICTTGQLGGAETAGRVTSFYSFAGIIGGLLTGTIISRLGRRVMPGISAVFAVGMLLMWRGSSMPALLVGTFITGMFVSVRMPAGYLSATEIAPAQATMMISLYCCAAQFGVFLSPYILKLISPDDTTAARFLACGAALAVMAVVGFIKTGRKTEK